MPAPNRRNVGASLAKQIATGRHTDNIGDARDRNVASRQRHASKWEASAAALDRAGRTLETRAEEVRVGSERVRNFGLYNDAVRRGLALPPLYPIEPGSPRYWLGWCLRCDAEMWVHKPKPKVPICDKCKAKAVTKQQAKPTSYENWCRV